MVTTQLPADNRLASHRADVWVAGLAAFVSSTMFSWRPSFWYDEAATIAAANRSEIDILRLLLNYDAVHGLYYLAMHAWFSLVPINEFTARVPSAVAVGVGAAGMIVLGRLVADRRTAWAAAVAFTIMPRTLWSAVEARPYAITAALAVWLTVVLVIAAKRRGAALWSLYALVLALGIVSFIYLSVLVAAHAVTLLVLPQTRRSLPAFGAAAVAGHVLASPLIGVAVTQSSQLAWINFVSRADYPRAIMLDQWFTWSKLSAASCALVVVGGLTVAALTRRGVRWPVAVAVPWFMIPTAAVVIYSVTVRNLYQPRYLTFTTPGLALLVGVGVIALSDDRRRITAALLALLALISQGAFFTQRETYPKPGRADYSAIANVVAAQAKPGDCVAFDMTIYGPLRAVAGARPDAFMGLNDVAAGASASDSGQLWTEDLPLDSDTVTQRLAGCSALWTLVPLDAPSPVIDAAAKQGLMVAHQWTLNRNAVVLLRRR
jgi:mannosyltransferase